MKAWKLLRTDRRSACVPFLISRHYAKGKTITPKHTYGEIRDKFSFNVKRWENLQKNVLNRKSPLFAFRNLREIARFLGVLDSLEKDGRLSPATLKKQVLQIIQRETSYRLVRCEIEPVRSSIEQRLWTNIQPTYEFVLCKSVTCLE